MADSPSLHDLLRAAAVELADLATQTDDLGGTRIVSPEQWQALDLISQRLAGLGTFLHALVPELPDCQPPVEYALSTVRVGALANRLRGCVEAEVNSGDLEFFEA
jgi:hypothetical protein